MIRDKKRYLLLKFEASAPLSSETAKHAVYEALLGFLGEHGASKTAVQLLEFNSEKQMGLAKCSIAHLDDAIAALALKRRFQNKDIAIRVQQVTALANRVWPPK